MCLRLIKKEVIVFILVVTLLLSVLFVSAETFTLSSQREITVGQNINYYYIKTTNKLTNNNNYFALSKTNKGYIALGLSDEYIGNMFLVPVFKHPSNSKWYLCPLINTGSYSVNLGSDYIDISGSGTYVCYRYDNPSLTGTVGITINQIKFKANSRYGRIKITVNLTVDTLTPEDTGFAYIFVPKNQNRFRYVKIGDNFVDLVGTEQSYSVDKNIKFYDSNQNYLKHMFDWSDMPSGTNYISKVVSLGSKKGLLLGSYGYGASNNIYIDPFYYVDYSPEPAQHLINGTVNLYDNNQFESTPDITIGISDNNDSTQYPTRRNFRDRARGMVGLNMDEISGLIFYNNYSDSLYGEIYGNANINTAGRINSGIYLDGNNQYVFINGSGSELDVGDTEDFVSCISFKTSVGGQWLYEMTETGTQQKIYELEMLSNGKLKANLRRGGKTSTMVPSGSYKDGEWHTVCFTSNSFTGHSSIYIDGILKKVRTGGTGPIFVEDVYLGINDDLSSDFTGYLDEFCYWKDNDINFTQIVDYYENYGCGNKSVINYLKGIAITGKWSQTFDITYSWFLRLEKVTLGRVNTLVYAYYNESALYTNINISKVLAGVGWFNINISDLLKFEKDNGMNYSSVRFYTDSGKPYYFSEVSLRKEAEDVENPVINYCQINDTNLTLNEVSRLECNVTDDVDVEYVYSVINDTNYTFIKSYDMYYYDWLCDINGAFFWNYTKAYDILFNNVTLDVGINFTCAFCIENWSMEYESCLINDGRLKYYVDENNCGTNNDLPGDNGTYVSCNYCSENVTGPFYNPDVCPYSGLWEQYYIDNNYETCCNITGLFSDCSTLYSPYANQTFNCTYLLEQITLLVDEEPYLHDRNYFIAKLNITNSTKCWSYVASTPDKKILQTNPQKTEYSESLLFRKKIETKEYFTPVRGTVNAYYTKQNLIPYEKFVLGMKCVTSDGTIYNGEKLISPRYQDLRRVTSRAVWGTKEMSMLIIVTFIGLFVIGIVIYAWKK